LELNDQTLKMSKTSKMSKTTMEKIGDQTSKTSKTYKTTKTTRKNIGSFTILVFSIFFFVSTFSVATAEQQRSSNREGKGKQSQTELTVLSVDILIVLTVDI
jgi:hypothetical protein